MTARDCFCVARKWQGSQWRSFNQVWKPEHRTVEVPMQSCYYPALRDSLLSSWLRVGICGCHQAWCWRVRDRRQTNHYQHGFFFGVPDEGEEIILIVFHYPVAAGWQCFAGFLNCDNLLVMIVCERGSFFSLRARCGRSTLHSCYPTTGRCSVPEGHAGAIGFAYHFECFPYGDIVAVCCLSTAAFHAQLLPSKSTELRPATGLTLPQPWAFLWSCLLRKRSSGYRDFQWNNLIFSCRVFSKYTVGRFGQFLLLNLDSPAGGRMQTRGLLRHS